MKTRVTQILKRIFAGTGGLLFGTTLQFAVAQNSENLPYLNAHLSQEQRATDLVHLEPRASQKVHFELKARDLGMVAEDGNPIVAQGDYTISIGGGQPETGAAITLHCLLTNALHTLRSFHGRRCLCLWIR